MKAIIYAGIGLFSAATIYGMADYYSTQKKGTLDKLYKEEEEVTPVTTEKKLLNTNTIPVNSTEANSTKNTVLLKAIKKTRQPKRTIRLDEFSRGRIVEPMPVEVVKPVQSQATEEPSKKETPLVIDPATTSVIEIIKPAVVKKDPERRLSLDMFSRAQLRDPARKTNKIKVN